MNYENTYELAGIIARYISLPLSVLFVFFGFIQQKEEVAKDFLHGLRYIALLGTIIAMILVYPTIFTAMISSSTSASESVSAELVDLVEANELDSIDTTSIEIHHSGWSWFSFGALFRETLQYFAYCLMRVLNVVAKLGSYIALMIQSILVFTCIALAPLGLSMLAVKQTSGAGVAFVTGSFGVAIMMLAIPIMDMVFFSCFGQIMTIILGKSMAATGLSSLFAPGASAGALMMGISLLGAVMLFMLIFMIALYVIAPFAFLRFLTSGSIVEGGKAVLAGAIGAGMAAGNAETEFSRGMAHRKDQQKRDAGSEEQKQAAQARVESAADVLAGKGTSRADIQAGRAAGILPQMALAALTPQVPHQSMASIQSGHRHSAPASPPIQSAATGGGLTGQPISMGVIRQAAGGNSASDAPPAPSSSPTSAREATPVFEQSPAIIAAPRHDSMAATPTIGGGSSNRKASPDSQAIRGSKATPALAPSMEPTDRPDLTSTGEAPNLPPAGLPPPPGGNGSS